MVRNTLVEAFEDIPRPALVLGNDYPDGHLIPPNRHRRCQMLYGASGAIKRALGAAPRHCLQTNDRSAP